VFGCAGVTAGLAAGLWAAASCGRKRHMPAQPGGGCFDDECAQRTGLILLAALLIMSASIYFS
jgi:hypothetical protein